MKGRAWTRDDQAKLAELLLEGKSDEAIGRALGRSAIAIEIRRKRTGLPSRTRSINSARRAAERLGMDATVLVNRIDRGLLKAQRGPRRGPYAQWQITDEALYDYVANPAAWPTYRVEDINDRELRLWAIECRRERYLTTGEVARRYHVTHGTVHAWITRGLLPAVRWANWRVPESALAGFVPPCDRLKRGGRMRSWTPGEDAKLRALRAVGWSWTVIAREMGRTVSSVHGRYQRTMGVAA